MSSRKEQRSDGILNSRHYMVPIKNRYTMLSRHQDEKTTNEGSSPSNSRYPAKNTLPRNCKRTRELQSKETTPTQQLRSSVPHPYSEHKTQSREESKSESESESVSEFHYIPTIINGLTEAHHTPKSETDDKIETKELPNELRETITLIVNGQINQTTKNNASSEQNDIQTLLSETTVRLSNKRTNYAKYCKHKVMIIGDSHLKGCASRVISSLDTRFNVCAFLKPGSSSLTLIETAKSDTDKLTKDDFLIVCSGANDIYKNSSNDALKNIIKFIQSVNNTNIILVCVPHRFDLSTNSDTNNRINLHNGKLLNLPKTFNHVNIIEPVNNRFLFTKHGLHMKGTGKELLSRQLSLCIYTLLGKPCLNSIALEWHTIAPQDNVSSTPKCSQLLLETVPKRTRRIPVTRTDDFLWEAQQQKMTLGN